MNNEISCPNCEEFLGKLGDLSRCPICGFLLVEGEEND